MNSRYTSRLTSILASFVVGFLFVSFLTSSANAQVEQIREDLRVINATKHDVSEPLSSVDVSALAPMRRGGEEYSEVENQPPMSRKAAQQPEGFVDPALQQNEGNLGAPTVLQNFDGLGNADNAEVIGGRVDPPDPVIEVGDDFIVEQINLTTAVYDKSGNLVMGPVPNNAFWADFGGVCETDNRGDAIVLYDQAEDRWITSQFANPGASNGAQCVAVSQSSDPTGAYYRYEFPTNGNDYPKSGVGTEAYYLSWRDYAGGGGGVWAAALDKEAMLQGDDAEMIAFGPSSFGTRPPADIDGELPPADTPHPFAGLEGNDAVSIYGLDPDFENPDNSTFDEIANVSVDPFQDPLCSDFRDACIPQPDGPVLETLSEVLMHRLNLRDYGDYMSMVTNHTVDVGEGRAGVRWYEFRNDGSGWSLHQQGTYAPDDGLNRWMGSVALDSEGGIALGFSVASNEQEPSIRFTGRPSGAPLGQMTFEEKTIMEGEASKTAPGFNNQNRWGDYSAMVTDAGNPSTFWYVNEYGAAPQSDQANWDTRIASFQFEVDDQTPPEAITDLSATPQGPVEVELTWTAPSDPPEGGSTGGYDIRYSTDPIETESDFEDAQQLEDIPSPSDPGVTDTASVGGLTPDTEYFFAIRSSDVVGNTSDLNTNLPVSATTDPAPIVGVDPDSVSNTLNTGASGSDILAILNDGDGTLTFTLEPNIGGFEIADPLEDVGNAASVERSFNPSDSDYDLSAAAIPEGAQSSSSDEAPVVRMLNADLGGSTYYGVNATDDTYVSFPGDQPENLQQFGSYSGAFPSAGDFSQGDESFVYELDVEGNLRKVDVETGDVEELGSLPGGSWNGMATDPINGDIYVQQDPGSGQEGTLYLLDPEAADVEEIGSFGIPSEIVTDIAIDGEGTMYAFTRVENNLYEIDKGTGEATLATPLDFNGGFDQGLTWDTKNDVLLLSGIAVDRGNQSELRSVNPQTGNTELIGLLGSAGGAQLGWIGTPIEAQVGEWLTVEPTEGEVQGGGSQDVTLNYQTSDFEEGNDLIGGRNYLADVVVESNDPSTPTETVPVTLTVEGTPAIAFSDDPLDFGQVFAGTSQTDTLSIINDSDDAILQVANLQTDSEAFTIVDNGGFVLNPGESMGLPITFAPDASDTFEGTLSLASSAGDQEIGLTGQGVPFVSIAPDSLEQTIDLTSGDSTATQEFTVTNEFDESLPFDVVIEALEGGSNSLDLTPKLADEELRRYRSLQARAPQSSDGDFSLEAAPNQKDGPATAVERLLNTVNDPTSVTAYGNEVIAPEIVSFDTGVPGSFTVLGEGVDSYAGNFGFGDNDQIYWVDNADNSLKTYALDDGTITTAGELDPMGSDATFTDMETDPTTGTTYVTTGAGDINRLYTIDVEDAELELVGQLGDTGEGFAGLAIDGEGVGYGHEIGNDEIHTVDLETGNTEVLGPTGIDANFAQTMTWDGNAGQVLMAALHDCTILGCASGTLRQVNRETGATMAIGSFPDGGGDEFGWLATPGTGIPWLATNLEQGTLPAGATLTLEAQYDASQQVEGEYDAQISIVGTQLQGEPSEALPVNLTVEATPVVFLSKDGLEYDSTFVNDTTSTQLVTLRNDGLANMNITDVSISEHFTVTPNPDSAFTLEPGDAQIFEVAFTPLTTGELTGTLSFEGDEVSGEVSLSGTGIPAPELVFSPENFEKQAYLGQMQEETVTVSNPGGNPLDYDLTVLPTTPPAQDVLLAEETFDEFLPEGWSRAGANDGENWTTDCFGSPGDLLPAAVFCWSPSTDGTQRLISPQMNTEGFSRVAVQFVHLINNFSDPGGYELRLETTGDGGETWTTVETFAPEDMPLTTETIKVDNEDVGSDEFHVAWTFDGDSFQINEWAVDDVSVFVEGQFLSVHPQSGTLEPSASDTLDLTIDAGVPGMEEGTFQSGINFSTNDPTAQSEDLPFILNVIEDLAVTPYPTMDEVHPNEEFGVDFNVESLDDLEVFSYELTMDYDSDRMQVQDVVSEGTLSEGLTLSSDIDNEEGTLTIVAADDGQDVPSGNSSPLFDLTGQGTLVSVDAQGEPGLGDVTLDLTEMVFNEGEPPATAKDSTISIVPLYGDTNLDLSVTAQDAMATLDYLVGKKEFNFEDAQTTQAEVSGDGDVSAFDASLILRRTVGLIDCFPVEPSCGAAQPALASNSEASSETGRFGEIFAWGEASRIETSTSKSTAESRSSEGTTLSLPLKTDKAVWDASYGKIRALEVSTEIAPDKVDVTEMKTHLPDDWQAVHHVSDDGTLTLSMAGTTPLNKVGKVATLTLQRKDEDATLELGGNVTINEGAGHELETKSIVSIPDEFALEGTFPNPFRQSATMKMDLPTDANVTVEVYDLLGRKVKTAYNGEMSAGTGRTVRISGSDLSSGTYFYRAQVEMDDNVRTESGKMTVVR